MMLFGVLMTDMMVIWSSDHWYGGHLWHKWIWNHNVWVRLSKVMIRARRACELPMSSHSKFKLVWHQFSTVQFSGHQLSGNFIQFSLGRQGQVPPFSLFSLVTNSSSPGCDVFFYLHQKWVVVFFLISASNNFRINQIYAWNRVRTSCANLLSYDFCLIFYELHHQYHLFMMKQCCPYACL